ncbi:MAG: hypothetical protein GY869_06055 [Planctomycetes bacterium]|nr:hypothetical protein [Planctomycetota bacterium]
MKRLAIFLSLILTTTALSQEPAPLYDIAIQNCLTQQTCPPPGESISIFVELANLGNLPAENIPLNFYYQNNLLETTRFIDLPIGAIKIVQFEWKIPQVELNQNDLSPVYFLTFKLGAAQNEQNLQDNQFTLALGIQKQQNQITPLHLIDPGMEVHQWIANEAHNYFTSQIEGADIGSYLGTIATSHGDNRNTLLEGTAAEDKNFRPPLNQFLPYLNHFCAGADGSEIYDGYGSSNSNLTQAQNIWPHALNAYPTNKPLAFYYLGHVAHLLADMTVPAHTHNDPHVAFLGDPDEYEETIGHDNNFKMWFFNGPRSGNFQQNLSLPDDLYWLFYRTINYTEDYDTGDYNGDGPPYYYPDDYDTQWHHPELVDKDTGGIDFTEVTTIGDDLMPYAMRRTAELYRLFYKQVDTTAPDCSLTYPNSENPNDPNQHNTTNPITLTTQAADPQSGIITQSYQYQYSCQIDENWTDWTTITPSPTTSSTTFTPPQDHTLYALRVTATNSAGNSTTSTTKYIKVNTPPPCTVNLNHLAQFQTQWLQTGDNLPADFNHDKIVNLKDYAHLSTYWLKNCPTPWPI